MKITILIITSSVLLCIGCSVAENNTQAYELNLENDQVPRYSVVELVQWKVAEKQIEVRFEELDDLAQRDRLGSPVARLIVEDKESGRVLFTKSADYHGSLLQRANFYVNGESAFIALWAGGSHGSFELYTVGGGGVTERLNEPFRDTFVPMTSPDTGETDIYLFDNSPLDNRPLMKKFVLKKEKYTLSETFSYADFHRKMSR